MTALSESVGCAMVIFFRKRPPWDRPNASLCTKTWASPVHKRVLHQRLGLDPFSRAKFNESSKTRGPLGQRVSRGQRGGPNPSRMGVTTEARTKHCCLTSPSTLATTPIYQMQPVTRHLSLTQSSGRTSIGARPPSPLPIPLALILIVCPRVVRRLANQKLQPRDLMPE